MVKTQLSLDPASDRLGQWFPDFIRATPNEIVTPHGTIIKYAEAEVTCSHIFYYEEQSVLVLFYFISVKTMLSA